MKTVTAILMVALALGSGVFMIATSPSHDKPFTKVIDGSTAAIHSLQCPGEYSAEGNEILTAVTVYGDQTNSERDRDRMAKLAAWAQQQPDPCVRKLYALWIGVHNDNRDEQDRRMNQYISEKSAVASGAVPTPDDYPGKLSPTDCSNDVCIVTGTQQP